VTPVVQFADVDEVWLQILIAPCRQPPVTTFIITARLAVLFEAAHQPFSYAYGLCYTRTYRKIHMNRHGEVYGGALFT